MEVLNVVVGVEEDLANSAKRVAHAVNVGKILDAMSSH